MAYTFRICELKTGDVLDSAPFEIEGEPSRVLQGHGTGTLKLPVLADGVPEGWEQMLLPWWALILVLDEDEKIVWHGIPNDDPTNSPETVTYPCVTIEGYFLRRYVPTLRFRGVDQADIAKHLASLCGDAAGIPLEYDCPKTGVLRDRDYEDDDNARVYNRLQELAAVENGFNWTVDVDWTDDTHSRVKYTFRTGYPYLGARVEYPDHVFEMPGNVTDFDHTRPWGEGDAATHVRAIGDGEGDAKVMSAPIIDQVREAAGWVRLEERRQFSGVTDQRSIQSHAHRTAAQLFGGQDILTLTVKSGAGTELGKLALGDSAKATINAPTRSIDATMIVVGWSLDPNAETYKPTLAKLEAS